MITSPSNTSTSTIHNVRLDSQFTITSNTTPADPNLSWAAKGLLWYILSRDPNWQVHVWQLAKIYIGNQKGGKRDAIQKLIKELRDAGYVKYTKYQNAEGQWHHRYDVYPMPNPDFQKKIPEQDVPATGVPATGDPVLLPKTTQPKTELDFDKTLSSLPVEKFITPEPTKPREQPTVKHQDVGGTLPCLHSDWTLFSSKFKLSVEQSETLQWLSSLGIDTTTETLAWWAKQYPMKRLDEVYQACCAKKVKSKGAYMQRLLKTNANVPTENSEANKAFAEEFKKINHWNALEIKDKYAIIYNGKAEIEISFNMDQAEFVSYLIGKLKAFGKREHAGEINLGAVMFEGYDD